VTLDYDAQTVPDSIEVRYRGRVIARTPGMVSGRGRIGFDWRPQGGDNVVEVVVIGPFANTRWRVPAELPDLMRARGKMAALAWRAAVRQTCRRKIRHTRRRGMESS
jgi:hypothetical protein